MFDRGVGGVPFRANEPETPAPCTHLQERRLFRVGPCQALIDLPGPFASPASPPKERQPMRLLDGRYQCVLCGAVLDIIPLTASPQAVLEARSGKPNVRVLSMDGLELHRCEVDA